MSETFTRDWVEMASANLTDNSFPSLVPTVTKPTGAGVVDWLAQSVGAGVPDAALVKFYGAGADDATVAFRLTGWDEIDGLWVPTPLCEIAGTLGTSVGIAAESVINTDRFCDTLVKTNGPSTMELFSPADNRIGWILLDTMGCPLIQLTVDIGTATNGNAIIKGV